jgi:hypothetical protein
MNLKAKKNMEYTENISIWNFNAHFITYVLKTETYGYGIFWKVADKEVGKLRIVSLYCWLPI